MVDGELELSVDEFLPDFDEPASTRTAVQDIAVQQMSFNQTTGLNLNKLFDSIDVQTAEWVATGQVKSAQDVARKLLDQLDNNSGAFRSFVTDQNGAYTNNGTNIEATQRLSQEALDSGTDYQKAKGGSTPYIWICVGINTCPDCLVRHGQIATYDEWLSAGLPGSGFSVCDRNCACVIEPTFALKEAGINVSDVQAPVLQLQKKLAKDGTKTGLKIKNVGAIIKGKGEARMEAAFKKVERNGIKITNPNTIEARRMFRELGNFNKPTP